MANITEAKRISKRIILTNLLTNDYSIALTPLLSGKHGIGKSQIAKQIAKELNGVSITIEGGTLKEGEITGIPYQYKNENGDIEFRFLPYYAIDRIQKAEKELSKNININNDIKTILEGSENTYSSTDLSFAQKVNMIKNHSITPVILFFDEINRTDVSVFRELMNIILTRTINGYKLPWWVFIIAAMNPSTQNSIYATNEMDPAQLDRFIKIKVREDADEWINYAAETNVNETLLKFISNNRDILSTNDSDLEDNDKPLPSPRGWNMIDLVLKGKYQLNDFFTKEEYKYLERDIRTIITSKVGSEASAMYYSSLNDNSRLVLAEDIFNNNAIELSSEIISLLKKQTTARNSITTNSIKGWLKHNIDSLIEDKQKMNNILKKLCLYMSAIDPSSRLMFAQSITNVISDEGNSVYDYIYEIFDDELVELLQKSNMNENLIKKAK